MDVINQSVTTNIDDLVLDQYLNLLKKQDQSALTEIYQMTSRLIYGFILSMLKNRHDAEDVLHDFYVTLFHSVQNYHSFGRPLAWMMAIARNLCLLKMREQTRTMAIPYDDYEISKEWENNLSIEDKLTIRDFMKQLNEEEQQIVWLHAVSGFKHREIAQMMDLTLGNVLSKYHRAIQKLKKSFAKGEK